MPKIMGINEKDLARIWKYYQDGMRWVEIRLQLKNAATIDPKWWLSQKRILVKLLLQKFEEKKVFDYQYPKDLTNTVTTRFLDEVKLCLYSGMNHDQIAAQMRVASKTFWYYRRNHAGLDYMMRHGLAKATQEVVNAMRQRAIGMKIKKTMLAQFQGTFTDERDIDVVLPPDVSAAQLWLVNKAGWKSENPIDNSEHNSNDEDAFDLSNLTDEELIAYKDLRGKLIAKKKEDGDDAIGTNSARSMG